MPNETRFEAINPVIPVRNMDDALRFYEESLGFRKGFDDTSEPGAPISPTTRGKYQSRSFGW